MTIIRITALAGILMALTGCVVPFGKSTGRDDDRSPYFSNSGDGHSAPNPGTQLRTGPAESLN